MLEGKPQAVADNPSCNSTGCARAEYGPVFRFANRIPNRLRLSRSSLPFHLTSGIIRVCFDLAGRFRNKDIPLC
jgi:hypothetical protein